MSLDLDFIDLQILEILQQDGRASHSAIAEAVGLSQPSVHDRVKKLEQRGVIKGYAAVVDPSALDLSVLAFINVRLNDYKTEGLAESIGELPNVLEVHHIAGEDCMIVKVRCRSPHNLEAVLKRIWESGPVASTSTTIAFSSYKETTALPVTNIRDEIEEQRSA